MGSEHASEQLIEFLRAAKAESSTGTQDLKEWVSDLNDLMTKLKGYLEPAVGQGLLTVERVDSTVQEERFGQYQVPSLRIVAPNDREVTVLPRGRFVIGGEGRVDVGSGPKTAIIIRHGRGLWKFQWQVGGPRGWDSAQVDADTFSATVLNLLT